MSDYSRLLTKMSELRAIEGEYRSLTDTYTSAVSVTATPTTPDTYTFTENINPISDTKTPLVIRPGEDYGEFWKYIGKIDPVVGSNNINTNSQKCWNMAANDPRLFQKVAYTGIDGTNTGQSDWDNRCYGLTPDAPADASYATPSPGYSSMVGNTSNSIYYTKLGITGTDDTENIAKASKIYDLQLRVDSLTRDIAASSGAGINTELRTLLGSAADSSQLITRINQYMNEGSSDISGNYYLMDKRKEMNNVYAEINGQTTLRARKYQFIFYIVSAIIIIIGYASYTSKLPLLEQVNTIKSYVGWGWWTNWWVITIVAIVFILSSFGWDMKGTILMVIRYLTDSEFWTGQLWWVGVTFMLLIMIFFYASFKSFFMEFDSGIKSIQSNLDGGGDSE